MLLRQEGDAELKDQHNMGHWQGKSTNVDSELSVPLLRVDVPIDH